MPEPQGTPSQIAQYRILSTLGTGGMAKVFLALDTKLERQVALKLLPRDGADAIATEARFLQEARAAARLDHPNVCAIYEVGEAPEGCFIAMQHIEGETLAARMARRRLDLKEALDIAIQLLDALAEAHAKGIVHRDIKPANLMLTSRDQVKVLDFGLAKSTLPGSDQVLLGLTQSGMVVGTVPYMSPEQLKAEPLDGRSDLFSAGTLLYEMASGRRPFLAKSGAEVMSAILREVPPLLEQDDAALPPPLRRILRHALEKDPNRRYPNAAAFREELAILRQAVGNTPDELTAAHPSSGASGMIASLRSSGMALRRSRGFRWALSAVFAVPLLLAGALWARGLLVSRASLDSIAVLPFLAPAGDAETELLAEGLMDQLIRDLARRPNLKVIARTSVMRYRGKEPDLKAVGRDLGVKAVLVGRLRTNGERRELAAELVDTTDLHQVWSESYRCSPADLPDLQSQLLQDLDRRARLSLPESRMPTRKRKLNPEAFDLFLRGRRELEKMTLEATQQAFRFFDQALRIDPGFAEVHAHKAYGYMVLSHRFMTSSEAMKAMMAEAEKALAIDPDLPEATTALAFAEAVFSHDYGKAEARFRRGIELAPGSAQAHELFGYFLSGMGKRSEAAAEIGKAVELDPISPRIHSVRGLASIMLQDWVAAERAAERITLLEPENTFARYLQARVALGRRDPAKALRLLEQAPEGDPTAAFYRGIALARLGQKGKAAGLLEGRGGVATVAANSHVYRAIGQLALGNKDRALQEIEQMILTKEEAVLFLNVEPSFEDLRQDERFRALLKRAGFLP